MTKMFLIPLTSKYPLQTIFIRRTEIRYTHCFFSDGLNAEYLRCEPKLGSSDILIGY